jgi:hypothetical protein
MINRLKTSTGNIFIGANRYPRSFWDDFVPSFMLPTPADQIATLEEYFMEL